jgi:hypothetical protein
MCICCEIFSLAMMLLNRRTPSLSKLRAFEGAGELMLNAVREGFDGRVQVIEMEGKISR